jgi:hypothetical protein
MMADKPYINRDRQSGLDLEKAASTIIKFKDWCAHLELACSEGGLVLTKLQGRSAVTFLSYCGELYKLIEKTDAGKDLITYRATFQGHLMAGKIRSMKHDRSHSAKDVEGEGSTAE